MSIVGILSSSLLPSSIQAVNSPQPSFQKEFQKLGEDLQSGNLSAARQAFSNFRQDLRSQGTPTPHHPHHHHGVGGSGEQTNLAQEFAQLGQDLQAGSISAARQAYSAVQQSFQAFGTNRGLTSLSSVA